jgi:hypothetical protein
MRDYDATEYHINTNSRNDCIVWYEIPQKNQSLLRDLESASESDMIAHMPPQGVPNEPPEIRSAGCGEVAGGALPGAPGNTSAVVYSVKLVPHHHRLFLIVSKTLY